MGYTQKVVIVGAGISGLACAYRLKQLGIPCIVLEAEGRAGGVISTVCRDGYLFELGPQCPRFPAAVWQMVKELQLEKEFVAGDPKAKRYIYRSGVLQPAPFAPGALLTTQLVGLSSKLRILTEALRTTKPPAHEETLAEFVTRKFGCDVVDNLVDPIASTVFFGDPYKIGMESAFPALVEWERNHGSLVRGAIRARNSKRAPGTAGHKPQRSRSMKVTDSLPSLGSFKTGMARLPERLAEELRGDIRFGVGVQRVTQQGSDTRESGADWQVELTDGEAITAEQVVLSIPAYQSGRVLEASVPPLAQELKAIEYSSMGIVSSGYHQRQLKGALNGFGFMVPRKEGLKTICTFWNSSLFRGRAPDGNALITSFVRSEAHDRTSFMDEESLARDIEKENAAILGITEQPGASHVRFYPRALPQYNVGHSMRISAIRAFLSMLPNLHLTGNYLKGRSIGDCVELAFEVAEKVHSQLKETNIQPVTSSFKE